jgi:CheY-like chemotaxis protein
MVVEDNEDLRDTLIEILESNGYESLGARDGRDALEQLAGLGSQPCIIVLDLMMPIMDGWSFRKEQLKRPEYASIPVVVISAYDRFPHDMQELQASAYLQKPIKITDLMAIVRRHCSGPANC